MLWVFEGEPGGIVLVKKNLSAKTVGIPEFPHPREWNLFFFDKTLTLLTGICPF